MVGGGSYFFKFLMQTQRLDLITHHLTRLRIRKRNYKTIQGSVLPLDGPQLYLELVHGVLDYAVDGLDDGLFLEFVELVDDVLGEGG